MKAMGKQRLFSDILLSCGGFMLGQVARQVTKDCSVWLSMGGGRGKNLLVWNNKVEVNVQRFKGLEHMLPMPYITVSDNREENVCKIAFTL